MQTKLFFVIMVLATSVQCDIMDELEQFDVAQKFETPEAFVNHVFKMLKVIAKGGCDLDEVDIDGKYIFLSVLIY